MKTKSQKTVDLFIEAEMLNPKIDIIKNDSMWNEWQKLTIEEKEEAFFYLFGRYSHLKEIISGKPNNRFN